MSIYDRRFGAPPGSSSGLGGGSFMNLPPGSNGPSNSMGLGSGVGIGGGGGNAGLASLLSIPNGSHNQHLGHLGHTHASSANGPATPLSGPSSLLSPSASHTQAPSQGLGVPGRSESTGPPLLLNNLAQHLNNPPVPGSHAHHQGLAMGSSHPHAQAQAQGQSQDQGQRHQGQSQSGDGGIGSVLSPVGGMSMNMPTNGAGAGAGGQYGMSSMASLNSINTMGSMANMAGMAGLMNPHGMQGQQPVKLLLLPNGAPPPAGSEEEKIYELITELLDPVSREQALLELSKKREMYEDLALVLWGGFGVMSSLLLEIVNVYPALHPPSLTAHASNRVCNALALLQCVASHSETRSLFLNAHIPLFLYPFLNTTSKTRPFEYLRLTSLGVIGALVKQNDNSDVINFLLSTEIIPLCLRIMETGSELSKTVAIFIVQKILLDDLGLQYICQTYERFYAVGAVLGNMVATLVETQAVRLLKHVVRCYLRMSDNPRAREALRACLPEALSNGSFNVALKGDQVTKRCLQTLLNNLNERSNE